MTIEFDISRSGYTIREAGTLDARALRMLLPQLRSGVEYFVAIANRGNYVIGAAAMTQSCRTQPHIGPGVILEVIEPCRRLGIATGFLLHLENVARQLFGANALYAAKRVENGSAEMQRWQWLGFRPCERVEEQSLPLTEFMPRLAPLIERMSRRGRIPATARIIPLYRSKLADVLRLHLDHMGGDRGELYRKLRGEGAGAFHPRYSRVLLIGDTVVGCILAHRLDKETAVVDADIVEPSLRGGWANILLKLEATKGALRLGIKNFRFTTFDHYTDTRSFANKLGGTTMRTTILLVRPIANLTAC